MGARTIRFRAWHKIRKEMYNVHGWHSEFIFKDTLDGVGVEGNPDFIENVVLMQFTGLTDKNGKEVFEHDIVCEFMAIRWSKEKASFEFYWTYNGESCDGDINWCEAPEFLLTCQIKGNVFQNPELLNQ